MQTVTITARPQGHHEFFRPVLARWETGMTIPVGHVAQDGHGDWHAGNLVYDTVHGAAMDVARRHFANAAGTPGSNDPNVNLVWGGAPYDDPEIVAAQQEFERRNLHEQ